MHVIPLEPPVTVVVPVYGDLPSLTACVESLKANIDQSRHHVLLMNDSGPDADEIETALLALIAGQPGFSYERNLRNLGFVGNCNRAALEIDQTDNDILLLNSDTMTTPGFLEELSGVLHASPEHGAVCARSNNATIASLPFKLRDPAVGRSIERTAQAHEQLKDSLPRFSISPVAMGFCILMRRELIREHGLFDEVFAPGYGEENDFCLRIGQAGFSSVIAHRALVFHVGARSFVGARREALRSSHEKILVTRYPFYPAAVQRYLHQERDPVDVFADAMAPGDDVVRALIDIDEAPGGRIDPWHEQLLDAATALASDTATFSVSVPDRAAASTARQSQLDGLWDVAIARAESPTAGQLARLNRTSLRWVLVSGAAGMNETGFADLVLGPAEVSVADLPGQVVDRFGRSAVNIDGLRRRWLALTSDPDYLSGASAPRERRRVRLMRRAERVAPGPVGLAKGLAKRVLGRE
jgi:GT2 family glycosyltransferase